MTSDIRSRFLGGLSREAAIEEITLVFGEPEDAGKIGGIVLLAFRNKSIQISMKNGRTLLVSLYYRSRALTSSWPEELKLPAALSGEMTEIELQQWLVDRDLQWERKLVAGDPDFKIGDDVRLCFENGCLSSVHISGDAISGPQTAMTVRTD